MIQSLTGFGRADIQEGGLRFSVEIRSVNNRYLEIGVKLPRSLMAHESELRNRVRSRIDRGKISLFIQESKDSIRSTRLAFNEQAALDLVEGLRQLASRIGVRDDLTLGDLIHLLDWVEGESDDEDSVERLALAMRGVDEALDDFERMREEEGANLESDFIARLGHIEDLVRLVEGKASENRELVLQKLRDRIEKYIPSDRVDGGRLEQEVAYIVDRLDVTEEIVRLRSHTQLFRAALDNGGSIGKRLNFILQEMNREVNTIGSKASDGEVAGWVVEAKEELEKLREQVQNVV